jgi:hypothetical protein
MNEQIRQLADQCTVQEFSDCTGGFETFDKEKFARLIVRECINQCAHAPDVSEDWYQGVKWVANEIAQHFGVAELKK